MKAERHPPRAETANDEAGETIPTVPHHLEAERMVLGTVLQEPEAMSQIAPAVEPEDFYSEKHRVLFQTMLDLYRDTGAVAFDQLIYRLDDLGLMELAGGFAYIDKHRNAWVAVSSPRGAAERVREKAALRRAMAVADEVREAAAEGGASLADVLAKAQRSLEAIPRKETEVASSRIADLVGPCIAEVERRWQLGSSLTGIPSDLEKLDAATCGWQPGDLIILAARSSMGKSALALQLAWAAANRHGHPTAYYSVEMSQEQLTLRLLASEARIPLQRLRSGRMLNEDWSRLVDAQERLMANENFHVIGAAGWKTDRLRADIRERRARDGLAFAVVDYLQLLSSDDPRAPREQQVARQSGALKQLAGELRIPIMALSQLSRAVENRSTHKPQMSDLRESGAIEQDADVILFIYRDDYYNPQSTDRGIAEIIIGKQRQGEMQTIRTAWLGEFTRFENLADEGGRGL